MLKYVTRLGVMKKYMFHYITFLLYFVIKLYIKHFFMVYQSCFVMFVGVNCLEIDL
jgi:hypothetical protein